MIVRKARGEIAPQESPLAWVVFTPDDPKGHDYYVFPDEEETEVIPLYRARAFPVPETRQTKHWVFDAAEKHRPIVEGLVGCEFDRKHLLYMLDRIKCHSFSATKACRWLGWIQGVLNEKHALTLDEAKAINKAATDAARIAEGGTK